MNEGKRPKPRIVSERRRKVVSKRPPDKVERHEWTAGSGKDVLLSRDVADRITAHCKEMGEKGLEAMGFLMGDYFSWRNNVYTVVHDIFTAELDSTEVSVKIDWSFPEEYIKQRERVSGDLLMVGWYHSHPGYSTFLSETDIRTQRAMFNSPFHVAIVVDPIERKMAAFKLEGGLEDARSKPVPSPGRDAYREVAIGIVGMGRMRRS